MTRRPQQSEAGKRRADGIQKAAKARAERLKCRACGRKSALSQVPPLDEYEPRIYVCRYCKAERPQPPR